MNYICFDIGGTITKHAVITDQTVILERGEYPTLFTIKENHIIASMLRILASYRKSYEIEGVAISSPGLIDPFHAKVLYANDLMPGYRGTDFKKEIQAVTGLLVSAENDVNCFALSETKSSSDYFLMITIGTGIGGAIVFNNKIVAGSNYSAGEFGQMKLDDTKWESLCSMKQLVADAQRHSLPIQNGKELFDLYDIGHPVAIELISKFYFHLSQGICNLVYIFNPDKIIIGGGISSRGNQFLAELQSHIDNLADPHYFGSTKIELAQHFNDGGMLGALIHHINISKNT